MPYCARCGVEVEQGVGACPLCELPIPSFDDLDPPGQPPQPRYPSATELSTPAQPWQIRMSIWATLTAIFVISLLVILASNLAFTGGELTWAGYAMGAITLAWAVATAILVIFRPPWLVLLCIYPPLVGFLALIDWLDGTFDWFLPVGLPIASATFLSFEISTIIWSAWPDRGRQSTRDPADLARDLQPGRRLRRLELYRPRRAHLVLGRPRRPHPLGGFLFVYHYVLRRVLKLERVFHI